MKETQNEIKQNIQGTKKWQEGNQDSKQRFGTKGRNEHPTGSEQRNKNPQKWREAEDLWGNLKCSNIRIIGVPEGEAQQQEIENLFEQIMKENLPNWAQEIDFQQVQEAQRISKEVGPKEGHTKAHHH